MLGLLHNFGTGLAHTRHITVVHIRCIKMVVMALTDALSVVFYMGA